MFYIYIYISAKHDGFKKLIKQTMYLWEIILLNLQFSCHIIA